MDKLTKSLLRKAPHKLFKITYTTAIPVTQFKLEAHSKLEVAQSLAENSHDRALSQIKEEIEEITQELFDESHYDYLEDATLFIHEDSLKFDELDSPRWHGSAYYNIELIGRQDVLLAIYKHVNGSNCEDITEIGEEFEIKPETNEDFLLDLIQGLDELELAILRERINTMADITKKQATERPEIFTNPILHAKQYVAWAEKTSKLLGFKS